MEITIGPRGILQINNARIVYRNFTGEKRSVYDTEGDRNFGLVIETQEQAEALIEEGWNVKIKPPRIEGDEPFMVLTVKVKYNDRGGPSAYLTSGRNMVKLDESTIGMLDNILIDNVDLDVRPYDWEMRGSTGRTAYLHSIHVTQRIDDRFAARFDEYSDGAEAF